MSDVYTSMDISLYTCTYLLCLYTSMRMHIQYIYIYIYIHVCVACLSLSLYIYLAGLFVQVSRMLGDGKFERGRLRDENLSFFFLILSFFLPLSFSHIFTFTIPFLLSLFVLPSFFSAFLHS